MVKRLSDLKTIEAKTNYIRELFQKEGYAILPNWVYDSTDGRIYAHTPDKEVWVTTWRRWQQGQRPKTQTLKSKKDFAESLGYELLEDKNFKVTARVKLRHPEGYVWEVLWHSFTSGSRDKRRSPEKYTHTYVKNYLAERRYELKSTYKNARTRMTTISPSGFVWKVRFENFLKGSRCPQESHRSSYGERLVCYILNECLVPSCTFRGQVPRKVVGRRLTFDFYIRGFLGSNLKLFIEYDGAQHYEEASNKGWAPLAVIKERDELKNKYCAEKGIKLIRIPYFWNNQQVYDHLKSELGEYIEDRELDWRGVPEEVPMVDVVDFADATSNKEAARKYNITTATIRNYRKRLGRPPKKSE